MNLTINAYPTILNEIIYRNQARRFILRLWLTIYVSYIWLTLRYSYFNGSHFQMNFDFPARLARLSEDLQIPTTIYDQTSANITVNILSDDIMSGSVICAHASHQQKVCQKFYFQIGYLIHTYVKIFVTINLFRIILLTCINFFQLYFGL